MRCHNFNAGPAVLPTSVLEHAQSELLDYRGTGMSIMEHSHRGKAYMAVHQEAITNLRTLLRLPESYGVLLLQGGASEQFAMVPLNLRAPGQVADYTHTGEWAKKAIGEAKLTGKVKIVADTSTAQPARMPRQQELQLTPGAAYLHFTSNETISGTQWKTFPVAEAPLVADMSSDLLSRPFDVSPFGLIYAGAQKNLGPAGVTIVVLRRDLAERAADPVPKYHRYKTHLDADSLYNTSPTFSIYLVSLVTRWLLDLGGVEAIEKRNQTKAGKLYAAIDASPFYRGTAAVEDRSLMNVTFRLPSEDLEARFVTEAEKQGMKGLKGHRSVGGIRASIYNALPEEGVDALVAFMKDFEKRNG